VTTSIVNSVGKMRREIAWWAAVRVKPEAKRTAVFKNGSIKAFKGSIKSGGHWPNSGEGFRLA